MPVVQFQNRKFQSDNNASKTQKENCAVCLLDFTPTDFCRETICWHIFHQDCLDQWLKKHENCPYCREGLTVKDLEENFKKPKQRRPLPKEEEEDQKSQLKESQKDENQTNEIELEQPFFRQPPQKPRRGRRQELQQSQQSSQQSQQQQLKWNQYNNRNQEPAEEIDEINLDNINSGTRFVQYSNASQNSQPGQPVNSQRQLLNQNPNYKRNLSERQQQFNNQRLLMQMRQQE